MIVKFATIDVDLFDHLDLGIRRSWRGLDLDKLSADQVEALRTYNGKIVQVHPEDADAFERATKPKSAPPLAPNQKPAK